MIILNPTLSVLFLFLMLMIETGSNDKTINFSLHIYEICEAFMMTNGFGGAFHFH